MSELLLTVDHKPPDDSKLPPLLFPVEAHFPRPVWDNHLSRSVAEFTQEQLWNGLSSLYDSNENLKGDASALDPSSRNPNGHDNAELLDGLLDSFMNGANKVLDELTVIGNSHPLLAIAIYAFHEVIKLDIARRDNNKKVLVVVLEMQNMLGPMFQMRNLDHKHMPERERKFHENRLKELVEIITQDIKVCRSDITHFINRKFVYKLVLAKGYEKKFAMHIETFLCRRVELQNVISEYVAIGISSANVALAEIGKKVEVTDEKLDKIAAVLFRNLDTPREKDVFRFMQQHGGPEKCVNDLDLLPKLISKAGESPQTGKVAVTSRAELEDVRKELSEALNEDLDKVLDKHFLRFEKVLQVQNNNMKRMASHLEDQGIMMQSQSSKLGQILDTVTTIMVLEEGKFRAKAVKLKDPEIQRVWTQMNLTSVVKAKVFVLTFRDHVRLDHSTAGTPNPASPIPSRATLQDDDPNFLQAQSPFSEDGTRNMLRPPMKLTESTRDYHTLQLAMNSIDAEEMSITLQSPVESSGSSTEDGVVEFADGAVEMPKPELQLSTTNAKPIAFEPLASMPQPHPHPPMRQSTLLTASSKESDEWVMEYIDAAYVKPIVEAIDEDGSGFISVQEANRFALARPDGMSLLHWMAYWAAGWHINISKYQKDIYTVLLQISDIVPHVLITNSIYVDDYLDVPILTRLDALMRSIRPVPDNVRKDHNLMEVANKVASLQMERLKTNLNDMGHVIESGLDATTIAGGSPRVETWILPLILLLLQRHRDVIRLAKTVVLDPREFDAHVQSLVSVFSVFDDRIESLEGAVPFKSHNSQYLLIFDARRDSLHSDIDAQFHNFSYGMFFAAFKKNEFNTSDHTLLSKVREYWRSDDTVNRPGVKPDVSILTKPVGETFDSDDPVLEPTSPPTGHIRHSMEGSWSGWFQPWDGTPNYIRPHRCVIHPIIANKLAGKAEAFCGPVNLHGSVEQAEETHANLQFHFDFIPENGLYGQQCCRGTYNAERDVIEGTYRWFTPITPVQTADIIPQSLFDGSVEGWIPRVDGSYDNKLPLSDPRTPTGTDQNEHDETLAEASFPVARNTQEEATANYMSVGHRQVEKYRAFELDHGTAFNAYDDEELVDGRKGDGRFTLTRIPVHLLRFRYLLDGSGTPPCWGIWPLARKRWAFAIECVLADTRSRMNSAKAFKESLIERRKWNYFAMRWYLTNPAADPTRGRWSPYEPLSREDWEGYESLESYVPPTNARLYERIAQYMARREVHIMPVGRLPCDVCNWNICFNRQQCIICKDDHLLLDHRDIDICYNCIDRPVPYREITHSKSHTLLRSPYRIHKYEYRTIIPEARFISERVKKMFAAQEEKRNEMMKSHHHRKNSKGKGAKHGRVVDDKESSLDSTPIYCACCAKVVSLPCWVCVVCSPYVFFCARCERTNAPVTNWAAFHHSKREHQILRIYNTVAVKTFRGSEGDNVGRQLEEINTTISSLEQKINKQLEEGKETKGVVDEMAKKVGINWSEEYAMSLGDDSEEAERTESHKLAETVDDEQQSGTFTPVDRAGTPTQPSEPAHAHGTGFGVDQSDLERRLAMLESTIGAKLSALESEKDKNIGVKIDALEAKMDALFALVQRLVSFLILTFLIGGMLAFYNSLSGHDKL